MRDLNGYKKILIFLGLLAAAFVMVFTTLHFAKTTGKSVESSQALTRNRLALFVQATLTEWNLLQISAESLENAELNHCLNGRRVKDPKSQAESPLCKVNQEHPLQLIDPTDLQHKRKLTGSKSAPAFYDDSLALCEAGSPDCRFEVVTSFIGICVNKPQETEKVCYQPDFIEVSASLRDLRVLNEPIMKIRSQHDLSLHLSQPLLFGMPQELMISAARPNAEFRVQLTNVPHTKSFGVWISCRAENSSLSVQCGAFDQNMTATVQVNYQNQDLNAQEFASQITLQASLAHGNAAATPEAKVKVRLAKFCVSPWGELLNEGQSAIAFEAPLAAPKVGCLSSQRICHDGVLNGKGNYNKCRSVVAINCRAPWGATVQDGDGIAAYQFALVPAGVNCPVETRICQAGRLLGSFVEPACRNLNPVACKLPWGEPLAHQESTAAFTAQGVSFGQSCNTSILVCDNGVIRGDPRAIYKNCTVDQPRACTTPWGEHIEHGRTVTAYIAPVLPRNQSCMESRASELRTCSDGTLSGSFAHRNCIVN